MYDVFVSDPVVADVNPTVYKLWLHGYTGIIYDLCLYVFLRVWCVSLFAHSVSHTHTHISLAHSHSL